MYGQRLIFKNYAIYVQHAEGYTSQHVIRETSRRIACGRAMSGLQGAKIAFCKAEDELTNDEKGMWDMPSYVARGQRAIDYSVLDMY